MTDDAPIVTTKGILGAVNEMCELTKDCVPAEHASLEEWEKFLEEIFELGTKPVRMFVYQGVLHEFIDGKWQPPVPQELIKLLGTKL